MEMDKLGVVTTFVHNIVVYNIPLLYGTVGEIVVEKSGSLNLGVEGIMAVGAIFGYIVGCYANSLLVGVLAAFLTAALCGLLFAVLTVSLQANQNITGLTLTIFGGGVANFFGGALNTMAGGVGQISVATTSAAYRANIPALANLGAPGRLLFSYGFMVYLAILLAVLLRWFLNRTRMGLNLRSVGENPDAAESVGTAAVH